MNLKVHHYQLPYSPNFPRQNSGKGVLFAIEGENKQIGYSDLHPWPNLGDLELNEQLQLLKLNKPTPQTQLSLEYAKRDLDAKTNSAGGIQYLKEIKNHFLVLENLTTINDLEIFLSNKFSSTNTSDSHYSPHILEKKFPATSLTLKLKLSPQLSTLTAELINEISNKYPQIQWRFDANSLFNNKEIFSFWIKLSLKSRQQVEFIEDPCLYDKNTWKQLEENGIPLAIDHEIQNWKNSNSSSSPTPSGKVVFVLKPAIHNMIKWKEELIQTPHQFVITSYLDHPVGLLHALWTTETFFVDFPTQLLTCGLNFPFYQTQLEQFWCGLSFDNSSYSWTGEHTYGIGFSKVLEGLSWQTIGIL